MSAIVQDEGSPVSAAGVPPSPHSRGEPRLGADDLRLLRLLATDLPAHAIAARLGCSDRTLRRRSRELCDRLGVRGRIEAAVWAARRQLV